MFYCFIDNLNDDMCTGSPDISINFFSKLTFFNVARSDSTSYNTAKFEIITSCRQNRRHRALNMNDVENPVVVEAVVITPKLFIGWLVSPVVVRSSNTSIDFDSRPTYKEQIAKLLAAWIVEYEWNEEDRIAEKLNIDNLR